MRLLKLCCVDCCIYVGHSTTKMKLRCLGEPLPSTGRTHLSEPRDSTPECLNIAPQENEIKCMGTVAGRPKAIGYFVWFLGSRIQGTTKFWGCAVSVSRRPGFTDIAVVGAAYVRYKFMSEMLTAQTNRLESSDRQWLHQVKN